MRHCYIRDDLSGDHYAVAPSATNIGQVLVQIQEQGVQVRISLTKEDVKHMIYLLEESIK